MDWVWIVVSVVVIMAVLFMLGLYLLRVANRRRGRVLLSDPKETNA